MFYVLALFVILLVGLPIFYYSKKRMDTRIDFVNSVFWFLLSVALLVINVIEGDMFFTIMWSFILALNTFSLVYNSVKLYRKLKGIDG